MRVLHFPAGVRTPMPELLRQFKRPRRLLRAHILELPRGERSRLIAETVIYTDSSRDIVRAQKYRAAMNQLAEILENGSL